MEFARAAAAWLVVAVVAASCIDAPTNGGEPQAALTAEPWGALPAAEPAQAAAAGEGVCPEGTEWVEQMGDCWSLSLPATDQGDAPAATAAPTAAGERVCPEGTEWVEQIGDCWSLSLPATDQGDAPAATAAPTAAPGSGSPGGIGAEIWDGLSATLGGLAVAAEHRDGYDRDRWAHWSDLDGDGCDTRREVLLDEAIVAPAVGEGCRLSGGVWLSAYDGAVEEGSGRGFDVDHLVPLYEAHKSGGHSWSAERRELYANDLGHPDALIAVSASSNRRKGASDPAEWLPDDIDVHCWYSAAWIEVKARWSLSVDPAEKAALEGLLASCSPGGGASTR